MARWLLKTDPRLFSFADLAAASVAVWNGIENPLALRHLARVRRGDEALVYHAGAERAVVGLARVTRGAYADPAATDPRRVVVEVEAAGLLRRPVPRRELAAVPALREFDLVRLPRLSVLPVPASAWREVVRRGGGLASTRRSLRGPRDGG